MIKRVKHLARALAVATVAALVVPAPALSQAPEAFDYIANPGLSQPQYETRRDSFRVPMDDGAELYVEVERPDAEGAFPVIAEISPYHGNGDRTGASGLPWPTGADVCDATVPLVLFDHCAAGHTEAPGISGYFAPRGYAVALVDLRGTGRSGGCLDLLGDRDAADMKQIVEWLATREWSAGRVGLMGLSYRGAAALRAAAEQPEGLATVVPIGTVASMYHHQFHAGVPYYQQWTAPMKGYPGESTSRHLPDEPHPAVAQWTEVAGVPTGDDFGRAPQDAACGWTSSAALSGGDSQLSGRYTDWHEERDFRAEVTAGEIPVFVVHGTKDVAARPIGADWFFGRDGSAGDKLWFGEWAHEAPRGAQWTYALHAWFDKHLQQRPVETGPPVEVFLDNASDDRVYAPATWARPATELVAYPTGDLTLSEAPATPAEASFTGHVLLGNRAVSINESESGFDSRDHTRALEFRSEPSPQGTLLWGEPSLRFVTSSTSPKTHLIATVYDEAPSGERISVTKFAVNPELRDGLSSSRPVVPGEKMTLRPPGFPTAHFLPAGHSLVLVVSTSDSEYYPTFTANPRVTVFTGPGETELRLPFVDAPVLAEDDVPLLP